MHSRVCACACLYTICIHHAILVCVSDAVSLCGSLFKTDLAACQKSLISSQLAGGKMNALPLKNKECWVIKRQRDGPCGETVIMFT